MKTVKITLTENDARLLRELLKHQINIHRRNVRKLQFAQRFKEGGVMPYDREKSKLYEQAKQQLINVHNSCADEFNVILENISGRMFQKGIKFDPQSLINNFKNLQK